MTDELDQLQAALSGMEQRPVDAVVGRDLSCTGCGYNLRGIAENASCPECGRAVKQSIHGDRLHFADPRWLVDVRRGLKFILIMLLGGYALSLLLVSLLPEDFMLRDLLVAVVVPSLSCVMVYVGVYKATSPEPMRATPEPPMSRRRLTRSMSIAAAVAGPAYLVGVFNPDSTGVYSHDHLSITLEFILLTGLLSWPVMIYGLFLHLLTLAHRIPDHQLIYMTRGLLIATPVVLLMHIAGQEGSLHLAILSYLLFLGLGWATIGLLWLHHHALGSAASVARGMARLHKG